MALFIANNMGSTTFRSDQVEIDLIAIAKTDVDLGFTESPVTPIEGFDCFEVTYTTLNETGPTPQRLFNLVNSVGFTSPPHIIIIGDDGTFVLADGTTTAAANGFALAPGSTTDPGSSLNPFANHICVIYDVTLCNGQGIWVDADGGGTTQMSTEVMLYHELSHAFHFATDTIAVDGSGNPDMAQEEVNAEIDENDMRDVSGLPHRDVNSHNGGCGGGPVSCCIIASLATNSPYSTEVTRLRRVRDSLLRNSDVGDSFFNQFFYEYYSFSPEITRLFGHFPTLKETTKLHFVNPLLLSLDMLFYYANNKGKNLVQFIQQQINNKEEVSITSIYLLHSIFIELEKSNFKTDVIEKMFGKIEGFETLGSYINKNMLEHGVIKWSLFDAMKIWLSAVINIYEQKENVETEIYEQISNWIAHFPITNVWNEFTKLQTIKELGNLEKYIFDANGKTIFSNRLLQKTSNYSTEIIQWSKN